MVPRRSGRLRTSRPLVELRATGCELAAGYLLSRPLPPAELAAVLDAGYPGLADEGRPPGQHVRA